MWIRSTAREGISLGVGKISLFIFSSLPSTNPTSSLPSHARYTSEAWEGKEPANKFIKCEKGKWWFSSFFQQRKDEEIKTITLVFWNYFFFERNKGWGFVQEARSIEQLHEKSMFLQPEPSLAQSQTERRFTSKSTFSIFSLKDFPWFPATDNRAQRFLIY